MHELIEMLQQSRGLDVSIFDREFLEMTFSKRCEATTDGNEVAYLQRLGADGPEAERFMRSLYVSYSEFFRNPLAFALLEQVILPGLVESARTTGRGELRAWSAGCATGQEAWSLAILLDELTRGLDRPVPYRIIATDRSEPDLETARAGAYGVEAVGNVRARHLRDCFSQQGTLFTLAPHLRNRVDFSTFELLDSQAIYPTASIYGGFDLVLCSNVLLYYRRETQALILDKLRRCLAPGGYLVVGETERPMVERSGGFRAVAHPAAVFQLWS